MLEQGKLQEDSVALLWKACASQLDLFTLKGSQFNRLSKIAAEQAALLEEAEHKKSEL